jgi:hypothetical protein
MKSKLAIFATPGNTSRLTADLLRAIGEEEARAIVLYPLETAGIPPRHDLAQSPVSRPGYPASGSRHTGAAAIKRQSRKRGRR